MGETEKARAPAAGNKSAQLRKEEPNMQSMFLTTITTIALLAGASAAHQKDTTFFTMIGGRCGQVTMPDDMAVHLTALLKTGTCTDKGFTVQQGTEVLPIPTLGDVTLSLYHRPTTTDMPLEDGMLDDTVDTQDDGCKAVSSATGDAGYTDSYRGWYDVQGCGKCNDYCRWVGDTGSGGDPSKKLQVPGGKNPSWWSCRLAGGSSNYSTRNHFKSFPYKKCSGKGAEAPGASAAKAPESAPKPGSLTLLGAGSCKNSDGKSPPRYYFDGFAKGMAGCQDICASEPSCVGFEYSPTFNNGKCQFFASKKPASAANFAGPHGPNDKLDIAKADNSDPSRKFDCYRKVTAAKAPESAPKP